jgi:hypothetical protein
MWELPLVASLRLPQAPEWRLVPGQARRLVLAEAGWYWIGKPSVSYWR